MTYPSYFLLWPVHITSPGLPWWWRNSFQGLTVCKAHISQFPLFHLILTISLSAFRNLGFVLNRLILFALREAFFVKLCLIAAPLLPKSQTENAFFCPQTCFSLLVRVIYSYSALPILFKRCCRKQSCIVLKQKTISEWDESSYLQPPAKNNWKKDDSQ